MDKQIIRKFANNYTSLFCAISILCTTSSTFADSKCITNSLANCKSNCEISNYPTTFNLSVDKYYSPYMGADWMISGLHAYQGIDDIIASSSACNTSTSMTLIRTTKLLFEFTLSSFSAVLQHEIFGHGARAREFNVPDIGYHINVFSGSTTYPNEAFNALNVNQRAALVAGGVEATSILSQQLEIDMIRSGSIDSRAAIMYLVNSLDESIYAFGLDGNALHPDNDSYTYIGNVNLWFNQEALTPNKLKAAVAWNWLDPMLYLSAWTLFKYLWIGYNTFDFAMLHMGEARFMPTTRTYLTPYGPEYNVLLNLYTPKEQYYGINFRYAKTEGKTAYGIDLTVAPLTNNECFYLVNKLSAWRQPHLLQPGTAATNTPKYGFGEYLALYYRLANGIFAKGELGYKVSGYIPGRQLSRGMYWNVGVTFDVNIPRA